MAITKFIPEVWASQLLQKLYKSLVFGSPTCVNRNYEGEIANYGDTVHIVEIGDPTIVDYTKNTDLPDPETLTDDELLLLIDQSKAFNFQVDDIDDAQSRNGGALMSDAAERAAFGLRDKADQYLAAKMVAGATTGLGLVDASSTVENVYDELIVPMGVALDENNVPTEGRFVVVTPAVYGKLQRDGRFIKQNESGTEALHNGVVGMAAGFTILKSNNAVDPSRTGLTAATHSGTKVIDGAAAGTFNQGDVGASISGTGVGASNTIASVSADGTSVTTTVNSSASATVSDIAVAGQKLCVAGTNIATSYAEQINKVEAYRPQLRFADALKGLHLYGGKVIRGQALVVASCKTS